MHSLESLNRPGLGPLGPYGDEPSPTDTYVKNGFSKLISINKPMKLNGVSSKERGN